MTIRNLSYAGLEAALNGYVGLDPVTRERLGQLHGRTVGVEVLGLGLALFFTADEAGRLQVLGALEGEPDCWLRGTPFDLLRAGDRDSGADQLFSQRVRIEGDSGLAHRFGAILGDMDIDGDLDFGDIEDFIFGLTDPNPYVAVYGVDPVYYGDIDQSGQFDFGDIDAFISLIRGEAVLGPRIRSIPEPAALTLLLAALACLLLWRAARKTHREHA